MNSLPRDACGEKVMSSLHGTYARIITKRMSHKFHGIV